MPLVYETSLAAAGNSTTSGSANTETDRFSLKAGAANANFQSLQLQGKSSLLSQISGLAMRMIKWGTASTGGTAMPLNPKLPGAQASTGVAISTPTAGTTRTNRIIIGCGTTTPGQWMARDNDSCISLQGSGSPSIDGMDVAGAVSLPFEYSFEEWE